MKHKNKKQSGADFRVPEFLKKIIADQKMVEERVRAEYEPVIERAAKCAKLGIAISKKLDSTETQLRSCEKTLCERDAELKAVRLQSSAWQKVATDNFKRAEMNGHFKWLFYFLVAINIAEGLTSIIVRFCK